MSFNGKLARMEWDVLDFGFEAPIYANWIQTVDFSWKMVM